MKDKIQFVKHSQKSVLHNPMMDGALDTQTIEIRRDPLTGAMSMFSDRLQDKVKVFFGDSDYNLIEKLAENSKKNCFLCGDKWKTITPTYPESIIPEGRVKVGEAVLFPNLFPVSQVHAVIRVGDKHYLPLKDFDAKRIAEAFQASLQFAKAIKAVDDTVDYLTINGNYLGPGGASIAHPHFQVVGGDTPYTYMENLFGHCKRYTDETSNSYFADLVEIEKEAGDRYVGNTGSVDWLTTFSPQGTNEVCGIITQKSDFLALTDEDIIGFADGLSRVLKGYDKMGISTFNFTIYSGMLGKQDDSFRCFIRVISRQNVYENYRADDYFLQKLLRNELILTPPEVLASDLNKSWYPQA